MAESYYKMIDGVRYDRQMLKIAETAAEKGEDLDVPQTKMLYEAMIDGNVITKTEQKTLDYIKKQFKFSDEAQMWLDEALEAWERQKKLAVKSGKKVKKEAERPPAQDRDKEKPEKSGPTPIIWKLLTIVFLVLIPVVFFVARSTAPNEPDPVMVSKVNQLSADLNQAETKLVEANTKVEALNRSVEEKTVQVEKITAQKAEIEKQVENKPAVVAEKISNKLEKMFENTSVQSEGEMVTIGFNKLQYLFETGSTTMTESLKTELARVIPKLVNSLKSYGGEISAIYLQGHSSSEWKYAKNDKEAYLNNMELSAERAIVVLDYCLGLFKSQADQDWLKEKLIIAGQLIPEDQSIGDKDKALAFSRRIAISVKLVDEMKADRTR